MPRRGASSKASAKVKRKTITTKLFQRKIQEKQKKNKKGRLNKKKTKEHIIIYINERKRRDTERWLKSIIIIGYLG
ncbi:MAG: hypothetical protein SOZ80_06080 [Prevotella sp.]|uniref:hypothetical protein n=1 Tax=Prevotella sp. TaxID=59823 RepID=UPI002A7F5914|nr:hypothetical protein [Prevotella sp.]MDY4020324.1 hypothetical protein [Prevotella sp.]